MSLPRPHYSAVAAVIAVAALVLSLLTVGAISPSSAAGQATFAGTVSTVLQPGFTGTVRVVASRGVEQANYIWTEVDGGAAEVDLTTGKYELVVEEAVEPYTLRFEYAGDSNFVSDWVLDAQGERIDIVMVAGAAHTVDFVLTPGAIVTGRVLGDGAVNSAATVSINATQWSFFGRSSRVVLDAATGEFTIDQLRTAPHRLSLCITGPWVCVGRDVLGWSTTSADVGTVDLAGRRTISGTVTVKADGNPYPGVRVRLSKVGSTSSMGSYVTASDGTYSIPRVPPGDYLICTDGYTATYDYIVPTCWGEETTPGGVPITVGLQDISNIDLEIEHRPSIRGTVTIKVDGVAVPFPDAQVSWAPAEFAQNWVKNRSWYGLNVASDGTFVTPDYLLPGEYVIKVEYHKEPAHVIREYYNDAHYAAAAQSIVVSADEHVDIGTIEMPTESLDIRRIAGANRYATAVEISRTAFPDPVMSAPVVYVASGTTFPDSLAAGPVVAAEGGVLLTVPQSILPEAVADELARLAPSKVVVVGGEPSVGAAVYDAIAEIVGSNNVSRIAGSNRYETGRLLIENVFSTSPHVYIATGANFPDALSAGPVAAQRRSPVLLVKGGASGLDSATLQLLDQLAPSGVTIVGSTGSVSVGIEESVRAWAADEEADVTVARRSGSNRYETSRAVNLDTVWPQEAIFVASGAGFADALAAAPLAAQWRAPVYLTPETCLYGGSANQPYAAILTLVGGSLSAAVENQVECW